MVDHFTFNLNNSNNGNYYCDVFSFIKQTIPPVVFKNERRTVTRITCLDVSSTDLVLGSNVGLLFAFKRRTPINDCPHFQAEILNSAISFIKVTNIPGLIGATSYSTIVIWSLYDEKEIFRANLSPKNTVHSTDIKPYITCLHFNESEPGITFLVGMSNGHVIQVQTSINDKQISTKFEIATIFVETDESVTLDHLNHKIVQLDVISPDRLLVSTCYRTVIVEGYKSSSPTVIQVGKNQRLTCGSYGACFLEESNLIFASRPSSHLLVADPMTGNGQKTFILKRSLKPEKIDEFDRLRKEKEQQTSPPFVLGRLIAVDSEKIISWNKSTFFMVNSSGTLLIDERNIDIIGITVVKQKQQQQQQGENREESNFKNTSNDCSLFEIFILSSQMILLRIMNFTYDDDNNSYLSSISFDETGDISTDETSPISFLPTNITTTFTSLINGLKVRSDSFESSSNPSQYTLNNEQISLNTIPGKREQVKFDDASTEELVVARKKFPTSSKGKKSSFSNKTEKSNIKKVTKEPNVSSSKSSLQFKSPSAIYDSTLYEEIASSNNTSENNLNEDTSVDESERLLQILKAYSFGKANDINDISQPQTDALTQNLSFIQEKELNSDEKIIPQVDQQKHDVDELPGNSTNNFLTSEPLVFSTFSMAIQSNENNIHDEKSEKYDLVFLKWILRTPEDGKNKLDLSSVVQICALQDEMRDGLALLVNTSNDWYIYIYPGSRKIKCPSSKSRVRNFHVSTNQIIILYQDGTLYKTVNWLTRKFFCLGPKFTKLEFKRCNCLIDISCNIIDQVNWACDQDGFGWVIKSSDSTAFLARDDASPQIRITTVAVSPRNSAIVWALDIFSRLYVREGIFNEKGDMDSLIAGIDWILVDDIPGRVSVIAASNDTIWIVCEVDGKDRIFKRLGIDPPRNYIGTEWQEFSLPVEEKIRCLSGNLTRKYLYYIDCSIFIFIFFKTFFLLQFPLQMTFGS